MKCFSLLLTSPVFSVSSCTTRIDADLPEATRIDADQHPNRIDADHPEVKLSSSLPHNLTRLVFPKYAPNPEPQFRPNLNLFIPHSEVLQEQGRKLEDRKKKKVVMGGEKKKVIIVNLCLLSWLKCNTDGAAKGAPGPVACGGIFRDSGAAFLGCFSMPIGTSFALQVELLGAMLAIEIAYDKGWHNLWIECDSVLVISAFHSVEIVPWKLRNRWKNCLELVSRMNFRFSHIYREGNHCTDKLASHGISLQGFFWWDFIPSFIREDFFRNRYALPNYRFK